MGGTIAVHTDRGRRGADRRRDGRLLDAVPRRRGRPRSQGGGGAASGGRARRHGLRPPRPARHAARHAAARRGEPRRRGARPRVRCLEVVYTPHPDVNRDHRVLFDSVAVATRPTPGQAVRRVLTYAPTSSTEWTPARLNWFVPNWFVDVSATMERKIAAFAHYETERREYPHPRSERAIRAAAEFYGSSCGCMRAEPFVLVRSLEAE